MVLLARVVPNIIFFAAATLQVVCEAHRMRIMNSWFLGTTQWLSVVLFCRSAGDA